MKAMYINGPSGYLDVLLSAENFSDFISRADVIKTIMQYDKNLMLEMKEKQENIASKKEDLEKKKAQLVSLQKDYSVKKSTLDKANSQKEAYYSKLEQDQKSLEKALKAEEEASKLLEKQIKALLAKKNTGKFSGSTTGILRVSDIGHMPPITSQYGMRYHPVLKVYKLHTGVDLGVPSGTPVYSMADGEVIMAEYNSAYGNVVVISHGGGITSLYAHNSKLLVKEGDKVKKGQLISKSGSTGYSTGPHLHFEVRKDGTPIDPNPYLIIGK
jgi:murein DD-endopeptidase MepM/ murein hydrolase activator NlpD